MRVIAGSARGTRLAPVPPGVRPVSDRAREGLFSSLGAAPVGSRVLDLYAGTGALGIEALSRGAAAATFVDRDPRAVRTIRENLRRTGLEARARVVRADARAYLRHPAEHRFDLVFLDPPYAAPDAEVEGVLRALERHLAPGALVVLTRPKRGSTLVVPLHFELRRRLAYGDSLVFLYRCTGEGPWA
ncbi:MAG TPA: 16S rRNA (guanine(966)-N(2))-methyltransferase RsmD [Actinomycetota bacterium]|nr:16S rRNA (guanine(966)-N(2))-methyltransferase RsmD [Actinomycetota bacterium]